ncbi:MAG: hypothetical protein ACOXZW_03670 [Bacilli bacterium]|jgi:hypothetical protein
MSNVRGEIKPLSSSVKSNWLNGLISDYNQLNMFISYLNNKMEPFKFNLEKLPPVFIMIINLLNKTIETQADDIVKHATVIIEQNNGQHYPQYKDILFYILIFKLRVGTDNINKICWSFLKGDDLYQPSNIPHPLLLILQQNQYPLDPAIIDDIYEKCTYQKPYFKKDKNSLYLPDFKMLGYLPYDARWHFLFNNSVSLKMKHTIISKHYHTDEIKDVKESLIQGINGEILLITEKYNFDFENHEITAGDLKTITNSFKALISKNPRLKMKYQIIKELDKEEKASQAGKPTALRLVKR